MLPLGDPLQESLQVPAYIFQTMLSTGLPVAIQPEAVSL